MSPPLLYRCRHAAGFHPEVSADPRHAAARKRSRPNSVRFATHDGSINTLEGPVAMHTGDAIITGPSGEQWPVQRARFETRYQPQPPLLMGQDGVYHSLPLPVLALQSAQPFTVLLADGVSALQGQPGDWLVDYGDGSLGVVAAALFDTLYTLDS